MDNIERLVDALRNPAMEIYYHGDVRQDAAELLSGESSIEQWRETCDEMTTYFAKEDFLCDARDLVADLLEKGVRKDNMIEGLKRLSNMLEQIEMEEFQAGESGRALFRRMVNKGESEQEVKAILARAHLRKVEKRLNGLSA
ncbi:hypothetical protein RBG11_004203 [Vibrio parahaemolyticus]|nr:hypothetical protein [Vibrio parahaemolyticus]